MYRDRPGAKYLLVGITRPTGKLNNPSLTVGARYHPLKIYVVFCMVVIYDFPGGSHLLTVGELASGMI